MLAKIGDRTRSNSVSKFCSNTIAGVESLESRTMFAATNDPMLGSQYALTNAAVTSAWSTTTGKASTVIADIDTGADYTHQDLYKNIWINQAEIPTAVKSKLTDTDGDNRITFYDLNSAADRQFMTDGNGNGYIDAGDLLRPVSQGGWEDGVNGKSNTNDVYTDDIVGWDFAENDNKPFDDGSTNAGHGTHTAGIIAAVGNNGVGISGVMQKASLMVVRMFADNGYSASTSRVAAAIRYTADNGSRVANASWGGVGYGSTGDALYNAISYAGSKGELFVTAAGNDGRNLDSAYYNEYPAEYNLSNIVVVGATTSSNSRASFSNYGAIQADMMAPGSGILSTLPGNKYASYSGTSMATPMVTGAAGLMLAANPALTTAQLKSRLIAGSDKSTALNNRSVSDGKLNVKNAVNNTAGIQLATLTTSSRSTTTVASDVLFTTSTGSTGTGGGYYGRHSFHGRA